MRHVRFRHTHLRNPLRRLTGRCRANWGGNLRRPPSLHVVGGHLYVVIGPLERQETWELGCNLDVGTMTKRKVSLWMHICIKPFMNMCRRVKWTRNSVCLCAQCADSKPLSLLSQPDQSKQPPTLSGLALTPVLWQEWALAGSRGLKWGKGFLSHDNKQPVECPFVYMPALKCQT